MTSLRLEFSYPPPGEAGGHLTVWVHVGNDYKPAQALVATQMQGIETDFASTLAEEVLGAFLYGEGRRDVTRAMAGVMRLARAHRHAHEF